MKKTILASAIAAATFSGAALAQESNLPTVYGNIQLAVMHDNIDGGGSSIEHFDNGSTIGVLHDHQIAPGVEGFFKAEFHFNADDNNDAGSGFYEIDEAYVGVRGDNFGQIWVGKDDSTYETAVDEINQFFRSEHFDNGSTIGVLHDHQIAPGVEGFFKAEFHFNADDNNDAGSGFYEIDEAYVGVRGDNFGQIWVGKDDSTYETAVDEINQFF